LRNAIALRPNDPEIHVQLGRMLASGGDLDRAVDSLRTAMRFRPGHPGALVELAQIVRGKLSSDEQILLEGALRSPNSESLRAAVNFALAQVCDARGEFARAAEHLRHANAIAKARKESMNKGYNPARFHDYMNRLLQTMTPEYFQRVNGFG